jgi:hypothetical protein
MEFFSFGSHTPDRVSFCPIHAQRGPCKHPDRNYRSSSFQGIKRFDLKTMIQHHLYDYMVNNPVIKTFTQSTNKSSYSSSDSVYETTIEIWMCGTKYSRDGKSLKEIIFENSKKRMASINWDFRGTGLVHDELLKICSNMRYNNFSESEIWEVIEPYKNQAAPGEIIGLLKKNKKT